ncbi:phosphoribosylamine--glycine ligase [Brachybacterium endophyticum]|uniref:Phosphoribosylamine--glycine ligase n=1 Tax=Brachybacterium endophyticum TaxID=2182385 RepID=A0A2U2RPN6_9MICO|nr:phosphoribosylamine--glycine ligase [Brachybacterium endophyticum]PWH07832.1 phosphoribosylamine--glycine ligase [Brachybacterium endophyticum]
MKILVIGSGGREHAIVRRLSRDTPAPVLHAAPGNPGIGDHAQCHDVAPEDLDGQLDLARELDPDLVVIGPEAPLVAGLADVLTEAGFTVFGPSADAARLEGSKAWAKEIMRAAGVPTAASVAVTTGDDMIPALNRVNPLRDVPFVVKADGLAAGKGVVVTDDIEHAIAHGRAVIGAGGSIVVEEYLDGPEVSLFCISDGTRVVPLAPAQDFKRTLDGDEGPNTGGMGAYSPLPWAEPGLVDEVVREVAQPTIDELARRGTPFVGVLYCGLALTRRGVRVVEFNARFGDPETQVVLERLTSPLGELLLAAARGELDTAPQPTWSDEAAVTVVLAAPGYPRRATVGDHISGFADAAAEGAIVIHAGTDVDPEGHLVSSGGRVLSVVGTGPDLTAARERAYAGIARMHLSGAHHRSDIAQGAAEAEAAARVTPPTAPEENPAGSEA